MLAGQLINPPFTPGKESTSTWGHGASWLQRFPSTADLVAAAQSAIYATYQCSCANAGEHMSTAGSLSLSPPLILCMLM